MGVMMENIPLYQGHDTGHSPSHGCVGWFRGQGCGGGQRANVARWMCQRGVVDVPVWHGGCASMAQWMCQRGMMDVPA